MKDSVTQTRAERAMPLIALLFAIGLLSVAIGAAAVEHGRERDSLERALKAEAGAQGQKLENYFARARSLTQITANNPAFRKFYEQGGGRADKVHSGNRVVKETQQALSYLEELFPGSIGEACFIDASGPENARAVKRRIADTGDLSADESEASFFVPTFALDAGQVYQGKPYFSPDTQEWVISNSSPVVMKNGAVPAIVHFEISVESFRRQAAETSDRFDIAIIEANSGKVIADSRFRQAPGEQSRLGRPNDHRFTQFFATAGRAFHSGVMEVSGRQSAFKTLASAPHNANNWVVVATARVPASTWTGHLGITEGAMILFALLFLAFAVLSFRASQGQLRSAALTDPLTDLGNRRSLLAELERLLPLATESRPLLLGLFDLDGFKSYNDTFGHPAGDALLVRISARLVEAMGPDGSAYRMGGDEFCLLAPLKPGQERAVLDAACAALSEHGEGFSIKASHGSILLPFETADPTEALGVADLRMYADKRGTRDSAGQQTTDVLVRLLAERYPDLEAHLDGVTALCTTVAETLDFPDAERAALLQAASLHDIGKAAVPDEILSKPGPLNEEEWAFMRQHTLVGERIMAEAPALSRAARLVRWSHERHDGSGYPDGLVGEKIPLASRVIAVCDAFDAMTASRPYRPVPMSTEGAIAELRKSAGTQFDPVVVEVFAHAIRDMPSSAPSGAALRNPVR